MEITSPKKKIISVTAYNDCIPSQMLYSKRSVIPLPSGIKKRVAGLNPKRFRISLHQSGIRQISKEQKNTDTNTAMNYEEL
ncbi:MAG: hypothetical protein JXA44_00195 [Methanospirillaceae archaeon]|nr:hypothetical protein [Methanospirillaceae archaeon]